MGTNFNWGAELEETNPQNGRFSRILRELSSLDDKTVIRRLETEMSFEWNDEYSIGVKEIDSQHRNFLRIIRKVVWINNETVNSADTDRLLDELLEYATLHFHSEESLMERYGYPKLDEQKREHEILTAELHMRISTLREESGSPAKMLYFLTQWFIKHTVYSDKDIGVYIAEQRRSIAYQFNPRLLKQKIVGFFTGKPRYDALVMDRDIAA
jgi:hemerythrin-like metal-binding protein